MTPRQLPGVNEWRRVACFVSWDSFYCFSFVFLVYVVFCFIVFGCQYQFSRLLGKTLLRNGLLCVKWGVKPYTLTHSVHFRDESFEAFDYTNTDKQTNNIQEKRPKKPTLIETSWPPVKKKCAQNTKSKPKRFCFPARIAELWHTLQQRTFPIIFALILQTIITAQMSYRGEGQPSVQS